MTAAAAEKALRAHAGEAYKIVSRAVLDALGALPNAAFAITAAPVFAMGFGGAILLLLDEDWAEAERHARALDVSADYGFLRWRGPRCQPWPAFVEQGDRGRNLGELREDLDELRRTSMRLGDSLWFSFFAGACPRLNYVDEGLAAADAGLAHCRDTTERQFEAKLWRLRGELMLRDGLGRRTCRRRSSRARRSA